MPECSPDPFVRPQGLPADKNYRYFNQPVEQIPGWQANVSQVLVHHANGGLIWKSIECIDVVTCIVLQPTQLEIQRKKIVALLTTDPTEVCTNIPVTNCPSSSPSPSPSPSPS